MVINSAELAGVSYSSALNSRLVPVLEVSVASQTSLAKASHSLVYCDNPQESRTFLFLFGVSGHQEKEKLVLPEEQLSKLRSPQMTSKATSSSGLAVLEEEVDFLNSDSQS